MDDWAEVLGGRSLADLARGLDRLEAQAGDYPPGAAKFREACREFQSGTFAGGAPRALPSVVAMLESATVTGSARAYLDLCKRITRGERLTRGELETLPALRTSGGDVIRPRDFCTASDDEVSA